MTDTGNTPLNIVICGVGGQGVLTLAEIMARAALIEGHNVRVGEIHGMAQRGGHVVCTVRIGPRASGPIVDVGSAHLMIGFEPIETLREIHLIRPDGFVLMNTHIVYPVAVSMGQSTYPPMEDIRSTIQKFTSHLLEFDAMSLAEEAGSSRSMNMVMFGAAIGTGLVPIKKDVASEVVASSFPERFREVNLTAFQSGFAAVQSVSRDTRITSSD